jgi:hypothetical protein
MKKNINIQIDKTIFKELESYAKELNKISKSITEESIIAYFTKLDEELSDKRINDIKFAKYQLLSLEDMIKNIGLEKC